MAKQKCGKVIGRFGGSEWGECERKCEGSGDAKKRAAENKQSNGNRHERQSHGNIWCKQERGRKRKARRRRRGKGEGLGEILWIGLGRGLKWKGGREKKNLRAEMRTGRIKETSSSTWCSKWVYAERSREWCSSTSFKTNSNSSNNNSRQWHCSSACWPDAAATATNSGFYGKPPRKQTRLKRLHSRWDTPNFKKYIVCIARIGW